MSYCDGEEAVAMTTQTIPTGIQRARAERWSARIVAIYSLFVEDARRIEPVRGQALSAWRAIDAGDTDAVRAAREMTSLLREWAVIDEAQLVQVAAPAVADRADVQAERPAGRSWGITPAQWAAVWVGVLVLTAAFWGGGWWLLHRGVERLP